MANLIREIVQKQPGNTPNTTVAIGAKGENVILDIGNSTVNDPPSLTSVKNTNPAIYYNNVQAQMYRKGHQIAKLRSDLTATTSAFSQSTTTLNNNINNISSAMSNIQVNDGRVNLLQASQRHIRDKLPLRDGETIKPDIKTLAAAIPYLASADPRLTGSTVPRAYFENTDDFYIKGEDTLPIISSKFNALRNTVNSMSTSSMSEDELIRRYYQNKQHYIVYNSNITAYEGYPSTDSRFLPQGASTEKPLLPGGFTRYMVYETSEDWTPTINATIDSAAKGYTTGGSWTGSTYTGPITNYPTLKQDNNGKYILKDKDKLPTPPDGYMWVCEYARGTFTHNNKNMLWIKKDGFYTYNGYVTGSSAGNGPIISCDIPVQNLYKGTSFTNLTDMLQDTDQWKATNLCSGNFYQRDDGQIGSILNSYAGTKIKLYLTNSTKTLNLYQYHRLAEKRSYRFNGVASSISGDTINTFQHIGNKYNQEDRIRLEARCGHSTAMSNGKYVYGSYFCTSHGLSDYDTLNWKSDGVFGASCLNMPLCFIFTTPFMYAEYTLVPTATQYYPLYWFNPSQDTNYTEDEGDEQNQSSQDS